MNTYTGDPLETADLAENYMDPNDPDLDVDTLPGIVGDLVLAGRSDLAAAWIERWTVEFDRLLDIAWRYETTSR